MIKLLSTDFDGTLVGYSPQRSCVPTLAKQLKGVQEDGGIWVINTGRPWEELLWGLEGLAIPFFPNFVIAHERHLYRCDDQGHFSALSEWNDRCDQQHQELFEKNRSFFNSLKEQLDHHEGIIYHTNEAGIIESLTALNEQILDDSIAQFWNPLDHPEEISFQRSNHYLRFCHHGYDKGVVLEELKQQLSIPTEAVLAIGDHCNDLPMLHPNVAQMIAAPANAHPEVRHRVITSSGYMADALYGEGTAEAIQFYR